MNSQGVTLVEVMISLVILLIVFMGLIQASLLSINHNLRNEVRDEAVRVAASSMSRLRSFNYSCGELDHHPSLQAVIQGTYSTCGYDPTNATFVASLPQMNTPQRNFRNLSITYTVKKGVEVGATTKRITVEVQWQYPGEPDTQTHTINYTMRNPLL